MQRSEIIQMISRDVFRVLDVGCAAGVNGKDIKDEFKCEVVGIEIDSAQAKIAEGKLDRVIVGDVETIDPNFELEYFDLIVFADVLEHLKDPLRAIRKYLDFLKPDGRVIISIPNVRHVSILGDLIFCGDWKYRQSGIMDEGHLRFFTLKSFIRMIESSGLLIIGISRIFSLRGSRIMNFMTFGLFKEFLTAQYVFCLRKA